MSDPKARVVDELLQHTTMTKDGAEAFADRLASAGLLASAPVVPDMGTMVKLFHDEYLKERRMNAGIKAISNHLLTLGWREK